MDKYTRIYVPEQTNKLDKLIIQLNAAKDAISNYDYIGIKIATDVASVDDYAEEIEYMESIRDVIREIEKEIKDINVQDIEEDQNEEIQTESE